MEVDGVERDLMPSEVSFMYLPPNALDNMMKVTYFYNVSCRLEIAPKLQHNMVHWSLDVGYY